MLINNYTTYFFAAQINIKLAERSILKIQRYIYLATRRNSIAKVNEHQRKLLLLREEILLVTLYRLINKIKKKFLSVSYYGKFSTFIYFLISRRITRNIYHLKFIKSQLAKLATLLLLRPEWLAKFERGSAEQQDKKYIQTISKHISKLFKQADIYKQICKSQVTSLLSCKNIQNIKLIKIVEGNQIVLKKLYTWLNKESFVHNNNVWTNFLQEIHCKNELYRFLAVIYSVGLEWYIYTNLEDKKLYLHLYFIKYAEQIEILSDKLLIHRAITWLGKFTSSKSINLKIVECKIFNQHGSHLNLVDIEIDIRQKQLIVIKPTKKSLKHILYTIRSGLYHKNNSGYWRLNNHTKTSKAISMINHLLLLWHNYYLNILDSLDKEILNHIVDKILYLWQRKKQKNNR